MAKELLIVFLYDTEINLREEEDPQNAVVYFYPSWVGANQRMALCGQLIGVTQFLLQGFSFPHIISLNSGKFTMKKIGPYILCVGTDRNISDWVLEKRCEMLHNTLIFFHGNLSVFHEDCEHDVGLERLTNAMEVYLPTLLYAGNIFSNTPTIRLPKSASSIFLEAAQILECLQDRNGVYGGAIFYQNKVVMSQLSTDVSKQIVVMDPYRVKIPVEHFETSFHLPAGVQLLVVYMEQNNLEVLKEQKLPSVSNRKTFVQDKNTENHISSSNKLMDNMKVERSKISTVLEEESELDQPSKISNSDLAEMPDVVKDTVKTLGKPDGNSKFADINVQSYVVDSFKKFTKSTSCSVESLKSSKTVPPKYCSFKNVRDSSDSNDKTPDEIKPSEEKSNFQAYYNTISDPTYPWFRFNGLPASKALHDDRVALYCQDIGSAHQTNAKDENKEDQKTEEKKEANPKRPTSIQLNLETTVKKKTRTANLNLNLKKEVPNFKEICSAVPPSQNDVPLTPLMSKLSMLDLSESKAATSCAKITTPSTSRGPIGLEDISQTFKDSFTEKMKAERPKRPTRVKKRPVEEKKVALKKSVLFVYGYQNISLYLLLDTESGQDKNLINSLWDTCCNSLPDLERHFQQCFESIPQTQTLNATNDSYSFINVHAEWETLQKSGAWTAPQMDLVHKLHEDFNADPTLTDLNIRLDDGVVYGNQMGDSQVFYQQNVGSVAGLPMPSDLMGVILLKAKRRLERDHSVLIL
ncbi:uncharacterized protein HPS4 isoform X1 [Planococcus citri]|uniref:uncharacterized protein HPS4 isoform X1 n=1 Tax=Planococcus citri TaxID=170843 RepID=UPI0031F84C69